MQPDDGTCLTMPLLGVLLLTSSVFRSNLRSDHGRTRQLQRTSTQTSDLGPQGNTALHCTVLCCIALHCIMMYCPTIYCTMMYCTMMYRIVLCCTVEDSHCLCLASPAGLPGCTAAYWSEGSVLAKLRWIDRHEPEAVQAASGVLFGG